jgi:hypothetical protein
MLEAPLHVAMSPSRRSTSAVCALAYASAAAERQILDRSVGHRQKGSRGLCRLNPFACCCLSAERRDTGEQRRTVCTPAPPARPRSCRAEQSCTRERRACVSGRTLLSPLSVIMAQNRARTAGAEAVVDAGAAKDGAGAGCRSAQDPIRRCARGTDAKDRGQKRTQWTDADAQYESGCGPATKA